MARRRHRMTWRLAVLMLALFVAGLAVVVRLVQVQVVDHEHYKAEARDEHEQQTTVRATRGAILDRNGYPLATTVRTFDIYIDPRIWSDDVDALRAAAFIAPLIGREPGELIIAVRQQAEGAYIAARQVDATVGMQVLTERPPGVNATETSSRFHPEGDLASVLLGFTGVDEAGLTGIEADYDRELGGVPGLVYVERDGRGQPIPFGRRVGTDPDPGGDVQLTIDRYIQSLVEEKIDETVEKNRAVAATILVMDPKTGEILAIASRPTFKFSKLNLDDPGQTELLRNRPVTDQYEPGSVMKTITMATAIDLGLVNPNTTYFDGGEAVVEGGEPIKNWDFSAHGTTTMTQVLQYSLNTGAVWVARLVGAESLYASLARFGFGEPTGIGLAGEAAGFVRTYHEDDWYPVDLATNSFGQGINVTPVQMLTAMASLVNGGQLMRPYIVKEVSSPEETRTYEPVVVRRTVSEETSRTMVEMMQAVVDGQVGHQAQVPGYQVGGKTGTTTFPGKIDTIASFVGFAPANDPKFIMLVRIDSTGDSLGGVIAAPVFADLAPKILSYLGVQPDSANTAAAAP